ncbi:CehA/McbA family metallohydrolase [Streptomyces lydicus]|uniref:CehA/McbA family metallohydrolase n=1 Tax=Streptomyces lydicus TaxID=47763 RepID=UPI0037D2B621
MSFPPVRAVGRGAAWYRGDCHVHSVRSGGGELTPEELALRARAAGLDTIATTEHRSAAEPGIWGHLAVEVWNGLWTSDLPWNADNEAALVEWGRSLAADIQTGAWRPAMGNSDTHLEGQIGIPHTVVFAEELSTKAILAGIRSGRSWIAESAAVEMSFTAHAEGRIAGVGERLATHGGQVEVRAAVRGVPAASVSFHTDRGEVHRASLPSDGAGVVQWRTTAEDSAFVRIEVRHPNGNVAALTNPIILT